MSVIQKIMALAILVLSVNSSFAAKREIALTIDDLPFVGESKNFHLNMIIDTLKEHEVTATGFIIAGNVHKENWPVLQRFKEAGFALGNHTLTHKNLNQAKTAEYIYEIEESDKRLQPVLTEPRFFRYPYLAIGTGEKRDTIRQVLAEKNYRNAPITIDSNDFVFNKLLLTVPEKGRRKFIETLKLAYIDFIWQQTLLAEEKSHYSKKSDQAQILLIHANLLNAYVLPDIINLYQQNGYTFVSLDEALKTRNLAEQDQHVRKKSVALAQGRK
ncbi:polysaccharide deacetylase family protein [Legionella sp. CNM-4043-24]|uniref:polysaccharide deacetylase family protein n=1 Tax=Legionella sp. CNM-4043-24 TaxID=3421646 RepID=UPI00403B25FF